MDPSGHFIETLFDVASIESSIYDFVKKPSWGNAGYLAWDVGATIVPGLPGSYTAKGAKVIKKGAKLLKGKKKVKIASKSKSKLKSFKIHKGSSKTKHGKKRANQRGFSHDKIVDIKKNYSQKVYQPGGRTVYAKKSGNYYDVVITNDDGKVITTVGGNTKSLKNWKDVTKMLNNNGGYSSLPD